MSLDFLMFAHYRLSQHDKNLVGEKEKMIELTSATFDKTVSESKYAVVDFWASWCGPCRQMAPILEQLAEEFSGVVDFFGVNVDEERSLAAEYKVSGIPNFILLKNGAPVASITGSRPRSEFAATIRQVFEL